MWENIKTNDPVTWFLGAIRIKSIVFQVNNKMIVKINLVFVSNAKFITMFILETKFQARFGHA